MRIRLLITVFSFAILSCNLDKTPQCGDSEVTKKAIEAFQNQIKAKLQEEYMTENFSRYDAMEYATNKGWDAEEYATQEKERASLKAERHADSVVANTSLVNIRTTSIEKEIKRCNCTAQIVNGDLKKIALTYSGQSTEDKEKSIYVEANYELQEWDILNLVS